MDSYSLGSSFLGCSLDGDSLVVKCSPLLRIYVSHCLLHPDDAITPSLLKIHEVKTLVEFLCEFFSESQISSLFYSSDSTSVVPFFPPSQS